MVNVYLSQDLSEVFKLKQLLGLSRSGELGESHPLQMGFQAAERELAGRNLSTNEREALARVKMSARIVFQNEGHWRPVGSRLLSDMLNEEECRSILFELHVMTFAVGPVTRDMSWRHYTHASPDIAASDPDMLVECKLVRSDKLFRIEAKLEEGRKQHSGLTVPYVIAVGFDHRFNRDEIEEILGLAETLKPWFERHPDVAAGLIFTPADPSLPPAKPIHNPLGLPGRVVLHGAVTEVIHHAAANPLPQGFTFKVIR